MNILAVDTASKSCSVAVVCDQRVLSETTLHTQETHSTHLMEMIASAIHQSKIAKHDLDGYAVTIGPGSFTGLRIGISTMKGIAEATGKPLVGVSSLDALALACASSNIPVCAMLDARRGEVYYAWYGFEHDRIKTKTKEAVAPPRQIALGREETCLFVGDGSAVYREILMERFGDRAQFAESACNHIRAVHVAWLGREKIGCSCDAGAKVVPRYIRKCDAEVKAGIGKPASAIIDNLSAF